MVSFLEALQIATSLSPTTRTHTLPLFKSYNHIITQDIKATKSLPPFDNSAMDGYAIMLDDYGSTCVCDGSIFAGDNATHITLTKGHTYKVMTGAMIPQHTQAIVQFEWTKDNGTAVQIPASDCLQSIKAGQNIRFKGEEIAPDSILLRKGQRLNHLDVSILASQGISAMESFTPLKIGIFSSGDEVIEPHQKAAPHQIYNTNATSLYTLLTQRGYQCSYEGILADDMNALCGKIEQFTQYDVAITSGGASVGDADLIKTALQAQGARFLFDGINVKPGRHLSCAMLKDTLIILLPGNPLALLLHTHTFVLSVLESLQGGRAIYPKSLTLKLSHDVKLKPNTTNMLLGNIQNDTFLLYNNGKIGSSSLVNMWKNNAIALFESTHTFSQGTAIKVIPYNADFCDIMDYMN
ncbi:molybdopterin molybdotransferase MoeA [uncultured Helicobacter sp.]|uniref:molybdopterin molybdotransferase MoeA n=2 Tax=uncultured Helicobacter sp. TaxID=175537 RepID=UPI0026315210|nr:molybdopterin molybdotransferase MoeA [uncultured Helicobacter sp.]